MPGGRIILKWIFALRVGDTWRVVVNTITNLQFFMKRGEYFD
jgi:hypothetical protein